MSYSLAPKKFKAPKIVIPVHIGYITSAGMPDNTEDTKFYKVEPLSDVKLQFDMYNIDDSVDMKHHLFADWIRNFMMRNLRSNSDQRRSFKSIRMGLDYGMSSRDISGLTNISEGNLDSFTAKYLGVWPVDEVDAHFPNRKRKPVDEARKKEIIERNLRGLPREQRHMTETEHEFVLRCTYDGIPDELLSKLVRNEEYEISRREKFMPHIGVDIYGDHCPAHKDRFKVDSQITDEVIKGIRKQISDSFGIKESMLFGSTEANNTPTEKVDPQAILKVMRENMLRIDAQPVFTDEEEQDFRNSIDAIRRDSVDALRYSVGIWGSSERQVQSIPRPEKKEEVSKMEKELEAKIDESIGIPLEHFEDDQVKTAFRKMMERG